MTSRERVLVSLDHRHPDSVPVDLGGHRSSGIAAMAYAGLKGELGISSGGIYVYDVVQQLAVVEEPVLDALGVDVVEMGRGFLRGDDEWQDWELPDSTPCKIPAYVDVRHRDDGWHILGKDGPEWAIMKPGCLYFEQVHFPWLGRRVSASDVDELADVLGDTMWTGVATPGGHLALDPAGLGELEAGARELRNRTDRAIVGLFGGNMFEIPQFLYRIDGYLESTALDPDACFALGERLYQIHLANLERWLGAVGPFIDIILFGDDLGGQNGPMISPQAYRRLYKPFHARLWNRAKELAEVKVLLHSCGGIEPLLDDLIEAGMDAVNPVQTTCAGMDPRRLKDTYGERLTLWGGGCDTRSVLPAGTPDEVRRHVTEQLEILAPGGGFVFQQVHNVLADVPPRNVMAMFEAVTRYNER